MAPRAATADSRTERVAPRPGPAGQRHEAIELAVADGLVLAAGPGRDLDDAGIGVVQHGAQIDRPVAGGDGRGAPAHGRVGVAERETSAASSSTAESLERPERGRPDGRIGGGESSASGRLVPTCPATATARRVGAGLAVTA